MATKTVPATEVATLREALLDADMRCQAAEEEIEALCLAASDRIDHGDTRIAKRLLDMISDRAHDAMNAINARAEELGCNFKEVSHG